MTTTILFSLYCTTTYVELQLINDNYGMVWYRGEHASCCLFMLFLKYLCIIEEVVQFALDCTIQIVVGSQENVVQLCSISTDTTMVIFF